MRNVRRVNLTDIWSWYRVELRVGDHLGRSEELVSRCVECDLAEPESLASLGGSAPGVVDGILSIILVGHATFVTIVFLFFPLIMVSLVIFVDGQDMLCILYVGQVYVLLACGKVFCHLLDE